jgi:hypothetical protein
MAEGYLILRLVNSSQLASRNTEGIRSPASVKLASTFSKRQAKRKVSIVFLS